MKIIENMIDEISLLLKNIFCKETQIQTYNRLIKLTDKQDIPAMTAQTAMNELCTHLLGHDWYVVDPLGSEQINTIIVYNIERKFKKYREVNK